MGDIVETLKNEISAQNDAVLKQETYLKAKKAYIQSLEEQLTAIETGKAKQVERQSKGHIFKRDPVKLDPTATNPAIPLEILEMILGKLDYKSLMTSRNVSKRWNGAVLNIFSKTPTNGERTRKLNLKKLFKSSNCNRIPDIEAKLTKRIYYNWNCECYKPSNCVCISSSKNKLFMFCQKFSTQIEVIDFRMSTAFAPIFLKAITNCCPNLKALYLESYCYSENSQEAAELIEMESMPQGLSRMNLNTMEFKHRSKNYPKCYHETLQRIISRSSNLKRLKIEANFYPNLTKNQNLTFLYFDGEVDKPNFSQTKFSEMLVQVKRSLEVLEIKTKDLRSTHPQGFTFPFMNALKKLIILDVLLHPLFQDEETIIETIDSKFPNLEHLEIESRDGRGVETLLNKAILGPQMHLLKIQTLIVDAIQNPSVLAPFSIWFPNLNELKMNLLGENYSEIGPPFSALKRLKLKHFSFSIEFSFQFSDLINALDKNQELFKGMDILEIHANEDSPNVDELQDEIIINTNGERKSARQVFCEWLQSTTKNMKSVIFGNFAFSGASALEVMSVIREQQLPVNFINTY